MLNQKKYQLIMKISVALFVAGCFIYGTQELFSLAYTCVYIFVVIRAISIPSKKRMKFMMIVSYTLFLVMMISIEEYMDFGDNTSILIRYFNKLFGVAGVILPFIIERFFIVNKYAAFYMPSLQDISTFSFNELNHNKEKIVGLVNDINKVGNSVSIKKLEDIITDLPRHSSFRYINDNTLTEEYFRIAAESLDDPRLYIIISNTGSAASELISVFTRKQYNHASLAFDADLKTIISYNGGEKVYPPGLNHEMVEFFNKKEDASIIVYALAVTVGQKQMIIDKVREINTEGSAYNILGLIFKYSHRANIMFCSQFVYTMLKYAGLQYFDKPEGKVTPADLVEMDYHRKLQFVYEIKLN